MVKNNINFVKTMLYYWPKKSIRCPFFPIFNDKITTLMPIFCQKNIKSLKNMLFSCPCFINQTSILSKRRCFLVIFFKFFIKNPFLSGPYLVKKNVNSVKTTLYYRPKRSIEHLIWSEFSRKITLIHIFYQKTSIL